VAGNIYIVIDETHCDAERIRIRVESEITVLSRLRYLDENLEGVGMAAAALLSSI